MCKAIPGSDASVSNRVHAVFCTFEARHIKIFRLSGSYRGRGNITTLLVMEILVIYHLKKSGLGGSFAYLQYLSV